MDSSALVCILLDEPEASDSIKAVRGAPSCGMPAPSWLETSMVFDGRMTFASHARLDEVTALLRINVVAFDSEHAALAREANLRFGKGRRAAKLNFGDCMAYALAKATGRPLLFKGNDFSQTDITPALIA